jgi:uridine kinase
VHTVDQISGLIQQRVSNNRLVIFVCGFGGAGKTTLCHQLVDLLTFPSVVFETDWYAKYPTIERRSRIKAALESGDAQVIEQEENPKNWYDWTGLVSGLNELQTSGKLAIRNGWSQRTGEKDFVIDLELPAQGDSAIICDGIYLLHDEIRPAADIIILIDTPVSECLSRSESRDRHRSSPEYLQYKSSLVDKYDKPYFAKFREHAHYLVTAQNHACYGIQIDQ